MNIFTAIIVYFLTFWTLLFAVLPWGNKTPEIPEEGMAGSAPANPHIKEKFIVCAILSLFFTGIIQLLVVYEVIDFYEISREMMLEDRQDLNK
ncbi:MAG: DUF1467 family protein [Pseudomonadota bacterium]